MIDSTFKKANILIVDDQEANIEVLEGLLEMQEYSNIKTTTDPRKVVSLYTSFKPDLILLDLSMPYLSGFEVMDQLKSVVPETTYLPILILTADAAPESKQRALSGGASDFLTKPFDLIEVGLRIRNLLHTGYLQQQLENQNQILTEKVAERTSELEKQNIELLSAKENAEVSDRLKTVFMNNISHEIRTPLNGIMGSGQIIADPDFPQEEKVPFFKMLNESSDRLLNTITSIMDISMLTSGNQKVYVKEFPIEKLFNEIDEKFRNQCEEKNLNFSCGKSKINPAVTIRGDEILIGKIISHLTDNAIKFSTEGSVEIGYEMKENEILVFVKDTGIGISEKYKSTIFDNFMQVDSANTRRFEGSGIGLSISKKIIELLGGKIWFDSEKDKGSNFYFTLPI